ncbi:MAG TPA: hypothetical protein VGM65_01390 [Candidatus Udaeobacter sp.]|jgi:antitoxin (DNA-binding transcriptional repressor) of toxin-antitoxin stability system
MTDIGKKHETISITKHGEVVAQLVPPPATAKKPWLRLAGAARIKGNIVRPTVTGATVKKFIEQEARNLRGRAD